MANKLREEEEKLAEVTGWRYKIVERGGRKLSELLVKSKMGENVEEWTAEYAEMLPNPSTVGEQVFHTKRVARVAWTLEGKYKARYVGESNRSAFERYNEHNDDATCTNTC